MRGKAGERKADEDGCKQQPKKIGVEYELTNAGLQTNLNYIGLTNVVPILSRSAGNKTGL